MPKICCCPLSLETNPKKQNKTTPAPPQKKKASQPPFLRVQRPVTTSRPLACRRSAGAAGPRRAPAPAPHRRLTGRKFWAGPNWVRLKIKRLGANRSSLLPFAKGAILHLSEPQPIEPQPIEPQPIEPQSKPGLLEGKGQSHPELGAAFSILYIGLGRPL